MAQLCHGVIDKLGMPAELALSIVVPIFKGKGDMRKCSCYVTVQLHKYGVMVVRRMLGKRLCLIVTVNEIQFLFYM